MTNGIKPSQHQIEGVRREKMALRREEVMKNKFPIVNMDKNELITFVILFIIASTIGMLIP